LPTWKRGGYVFRMYDRDHPPPHVHVFKDYVLLDRYDVANGRFMDGTIGKHRGRVLKALRALGLIE
jgi:hypothetical protein